MESLQLANVGPRAAPEFVLGVVARTSFGRPSRANGKWWNKCRLVQTTICARGLQPGSDARGKGSDLFLVVSNIACFHTRLKAWESAVAKAQLGMEPCRMYVIDLPTKPGTLERA